MIPQHAKDAVDREIITPMTALYSSPFGTDLSQLPDVTKQYVEALAKFKPQVLEAAWTSVRDSYKKTTYPPIPTFVEACLDAEARLTQRKSKAPTSWRDGYWDAVQECVDEYMSGFRMGKLAATARDEGYFFQLEDYVKTRAQYQAQIVVRCERQKVPYEINFYGRELIDYYGLKDMDRRQGIEVQIPSAAIADCKQRARQQAEMYKPTKSTAPTAPPLDLETEPSESSAGEPPPADELDALVESQP